ncbi:M81 family metallopeptidase [Pseudorhodoferax sp. Leaf267]|uniref:M81 family metallopeptidase n=1 Tax=Pseudorhodoferax sp. Leaf267 TaxID=1736316 RepID=UPI0006FF695F|nr:M81 family metallopeptidase [Pseudorhodoferax sp. Leaf267]KQP12626.1 microcystin degradation protein MlrC [Pseudorhodoferax sp. Leaf267]
MNILVAGYQHETNTFAPTLADWAAFNRGDTFPAYVHGQAMLDQLRGVNIPLGGFIDAAATRGWRLVPSCWAGAIPSSFVTQDAFERIAGSILADVRRGGFDAVYLDLHGAAVAEHAADSEGELIARIRAIVGPGLPIVASLDLHANVTQRMLREADALVAYRSYPHVDIAATGELAAELLARRVHAGRREPMRAQRLPFLIPLNAQSTWMEPAKSLYDALVAIDRRHGTVSSFCMGFPAADFDECAPMVWSHGAAAAAATAELFALVSQPAQWQPDYLDAADAVAQALVLAAHAERPVVLADTQDNPGAGGDSNTTGLLHALLQQGAGKRHPGRVALGLMFDEAAAARAHAAGIGATLELALGTAVPTFTGQPSDPPVQGRYTVRALADGRVTLKGAMMTGVALTLGPSALLEIEGVLVAVVSGKMQLLDRELLAMLGVRAEAMKIIVVKSSNHFRADFTPIASRILVAKAAGPMAADPGDLPWKHLNPGVRPRP